MDSTLITGLLAAFIAVFFTHRQMQKHAITQTLDVFKEFTSERMSEARRLAWQAKPKWFSNPNYRDFCMRELFSGLNVEPEQTTHIEMSVVEINEGQNAIYDMLDFFSILAYHPGNDSTLRDFSSYYFWWCGLLWSFVDTYEKEYEKLPLTAIQRRQFPLTPWRKHLKHLERRISCSPYCQDEHILYKDYERF